MAAARPPTWSVPGLPAVLEPAGGWWTAEGPPPAGHAPPAGAARGEPEAPAAMTVLAGLAAELATLKRVRDAQSADSVASRLFRRAWEAVLLGEDVGRVALSTTADALAALRLGAMDSALLSRLGVASQAIGDILVASFDEVSGPVAPGLRGALRAHLGDPIPTAGVVPGFVEALIRQPRAGATCPGRARIILEPQEGHGDHCLVVAVLGVVMAGHYGGRPEVAFLAGLAHHLHNAVMPDSGFAGEMLLGAHLVPVMERVFAATIEAMPPALGGAVREAMRAAAGAETAEGRAFNAADVIDRIMEMRHFASVAGFTTGQALGEMELVHVGPLQAFHHAVMREAGLMEGVDAAHAPGTAGERGGFDVGEGVLDAVVEDGEAGAAAGR